MEIIWKFSEFYDIVNTILKFAEPSGAFATSNYVFPDAEEIILVSPYGGAVWFSDKKFEQLLILPVEVLQRINSLSAKYKEVRIVKLEEKWEIKLGRIRIEVPFITETEWFLPDFSEDTVAFSSEVFETMKELIFSVSEDVRRSNLYGIWYSGTEHCLYASDNYRVTRTKEEVLFKNAGDIFFPREFLDRVLKLDEAPQSLSLSENALMLYYEKFLCFSLLQAVTIPPFATAFDREVNGQTLGMDLLVDLDLEKGLVSDFGLFLREGDEWTNLSVLVEEEKLTIKSVPRSGGSIFELVVPLRHSTKQVGEFEINSRFFLEALIKFGSFYKVSERCLFFENEMFEHLVFLLSQQ